MLLFKVCLTLRYNSVRLKYEFVDYTKTLTPPNLGHAVSGVLAWHTVQGHLEE